MLELACSYIQSDNRIKFSYFKLIRFRSQILAEINCENFKFFFPIHRKLNFDLNSTSNRISWLESVDIIIGCINLKISTRPNSRHASKLLQRSSISLTGLIENKTNIPDASIYPERLKVSQLLQNWSMLQIRKKQWNSRRVAFWPLLSEVDL